MGWSQLSQNFCGPDQGFYNFSLDLNTLFAHEAFVIQQCKLGGKGTNH
jgi:hypothetical protein